MICGSNECGMPLTLCTYPQIRKMGRPMKERVKYPTIPKTAPKTIIGHFHPAVGWLNYSAGDATLKFDEDITPRLRCRSPGFYRATARELASLRVGSRAFVTLCSLAPGEYEYRVELEGRQQPLLGKLVVEAEG